MSKASYFVNSPLRWVFFIVSSLVLVLSTASAQTSDLFISLSSNLSIAKVNDNVVFTVNVKNGGPNIAANTRVTDVLPSGYTLINAAPSIGSFTDPIWTIGDLPVNGTASIVITAKVSPFGNYTNTVAIKADQPDLNLGDNTAKTSLGVIRAIDDYAYVNQLATGTVIGNVLANDFLNGSFADISKLNLSQVSSSDPNLNLNASTGEIVLTNALVTGNYLLVYKIVDKQNPLLFTTGNVFINSNSSNGGVIDEPIVANHDAGSAPEIIGGIAVFNILANDKLAGEFATLDNVDLTFLSSTDPNITLDLATAKVLVAPNTPGGPYILNYKITSKADASITATSYVTVNVIGTGALDTKDDYGAVNGITGGVAVTNVLANDLFNGNVVRIEDVDLTQLFTSISGIELNETTGEVTVAPNTPNGFFTLTYQVIDKLDPTNKGAADVIVTVTGGADVIKAIEDRGVANGTSGGIAIENILANDELKGVVPNISDVYISQLFSNNSAINIDFNTGQVIVNPGTKNGFYTLTYQIQDKTNEVNVSFADIIVEVTGGLSLLTAKEDAGGASGVVGGVAVANVLANDDLAGVAPLLSDVNIQQTFSNNSGINLDVNTGQVVVDAGTENGVYTVAYYIEDKNNPESSSYADVIVTVTQENIHILANPDVGSANGITGGEAVANVLENDVLAQNTPLMTDVDLVQLSSDNPGVYLDEATGKVLVSAGTPNGSYTLKYQIADKANPADISIADVTVTVNSGTPILKAELDNGIVNNVTGGIAVANILANDSLNGNTPLIGDVNILQLYSEDPQFFSIDKNTGQAIVQPGAPIGFFTVTYQFEDKSNLGLTAVADVVIEVTADDNPIVANDDVGEITGINGGVAVADVLNNDLINGAFATLTEVILVQVSASNPGISLEAATGRVLIADGTPTGDYVLKYKITDKIDLTEFAEANVYVKVISLLPIATDDTGTVNGSTGGTAVNNVLSNDSFNGATALLTNVIISQITASPYITIDPSTGKVTVALNTPADIYNITYQIVDKINPTNIATAKVVVTVTAPVISATDDAGTVNGFVGGTAVANILANDAFNGATALLTNLSISQTAVNPNISIEATTGKVRVAPNTPAGIYDIEYQITDKINPTNIATAKVVVTVTAPSISATDDAGTVNGSTGGVAVENILANDIFDGATALPSNVTVSQITVNPNVTIDPATGKVNVAPNTPATIYTIDYQITDKINPTNIATAKVAVTVNPATISAIDDEKTVEGAVDVVAITDITSNDFLNNVPADITKVNITNIVNSNPNILVDAITGSVTVKKEALAGTYVINYTLQDKGNASLTSTAKITIIVKAKPILGIAKTVSTPKKETDGSYTISYSLKVKNYGNTDLTAINVTDDLVKTFPAPVSFTMVGNVQASGTLIANPLFNGISVTSLLEAGSVLQAIQEENITFELNIKLNNTSENIFNNIAAASANSLGGVVTDSSTDGTNPDPDNNNNPQETTATQLTLDKSPIRIPQGFSPNNDGVHDKFVIENIVGSTISLEIFNRWGNIVYKNIDYKNDWTGQSNEGITIGQDLPDGTYYYIVKVNGKDKYVKYFTIKR